MFSPKKAPSLVLAALVAVAIPIVPALQVQAQTTGQSDLSLPQSMAAGTKVWIDGDPSLKPATESLSSSFEAQFPGASIHHESQGSDPAVIGVIAGWLDVAAIGRSLTRQEEKAGVETLSLAREKIATFVGVDNPFQGEISDQQFAQIFRGEISNWSELGGENLPIRFIDLAATSDTRRSLGDYALFEEAPFESGETAIIQPNNINSVIESLGNDGIGYALFDQVKDRPDVRILPMHGVMPTDVRYPFSQPRNLAYLGENPTPEAIAFLGYVSDTTPRNSAINGAGPQDWTLGHNAKALGHHPTLQSPASLQDTVADSTSAQAEGQRDRTHGTSDRPGIIDSINVPWWWLLPLTSLGIIGYAAMSRKRLDPDPAASLGTAATAAGMAGTGLAGIGLAARGLRGWSTTQWNSNSLANGTIANDDAAGFALGSSPHQTPHHQTVNALDLMAGAGLATAGLAGAGMVAAKASDHDATLVDKTERKLKEQDMLASDRRHHERVDHSINKALERPNGGKKNMPPQGQQLQKQELLYDNPKPEATETATSLHPKAPVSPQNSATSRNQGKLSAEENTALGNVLKHAGLETADLAGAAGLTNPQAAEEKTNHAPEFVVAATSEMEPTGPSSRLDAPMAGLGNSDNEQTWITLTPLNSHQGEVNWHISEEHRLEAKRQGGQRMMICIHDADPSTQTEPWLISSYTYDCRNSMDRKRVDLPVPDRDYVAEIGFLTADEDWIHIARSFHSHSPTAEYDGCRIVIMPCDPHRQMRGGPARHPKPQAYVYWDIAPEFKRRLRKQGGQMMALRIYDADHINLDQQAPHHTDEYMLDENARDKVVTVPTEEHDYVAEIGYLTIDGEFLSLGRSVFAHIPVAVAQR